MSFKFPNKTLSHSKSAMRLFSGVLMCIAAGDTLGQAPREQNEVRAELFYIKQQVDNPSALADDIAGAQEGESQTEAGALINGEWSSELNSLVLDYSQSELRFEDGNQSDTTVREGGGTWVLGNEHTFYQLTTAHSIRRLQREAGQASSQLDETEERSISSVRPLLRARFGAADALALSANMSDIGFEESVINNSKREGALLQYSRGVSPTTGLFITGGVNRVNFEENDNADYKYTMVNVGFTREQRFFSYRLSAGMASISPEIGQSTSSPTANFELISENSGNRIEFVADRSISDTSIGNNNSELFSDEVTFDGDIEENDQIIRSQGSLNWQYANLCRRCSVELGVTWERSEHLNAEYLDLEQTRADLRVLYRVNRRLDAVFHSQQVDTTFPDPDSTQVDSARELHSVEFNYALNDMFELSLFHEAERVERKGEGDTSVNTSGIELTFVYQR
ncbi:MAG: hypothetical protein K6L76_12575 [Agarilytica sp.]